LELTFFTALTIGLLGSTHCIGMCGGIVGALNVGLPQSHRQSHLSRMTHHLTYNTGRIVSYMLAGALAGLIGTQATRFAADTALPAGRVIAGLLMIALGLYLAGWWQGFKGIEKAGQRGALLMLGFGFGTLPMLLAMGTVAGQLRKIMQHTIVRRITGTVIMLFGAYTCVTAFSEDRHHHTAANHDITGLEAVSTCPEQYFDYRSLDQVRYVV
jgi:sulfite exporter TauE/SafE